jgi:hypothetical protein
MTEQVYGFNESDAKFLAATVKGSGTNDVANGRNHRFRILQGKTKAGGIPAASSANVYYREPTSTAWQDTTLEYEVFNAHPTAAVGASKVIFFAPVNGRWTVIAELC